MSNDNGEGDAQAPQGGAAEGGAPEDAAVRLDKRTHLDRGYRGSFIHYGDGLAEVSFGFSSTTFRLKAAKGESEKREENEIRSVRRAKKLLRQKVLASGADHLLTLTYRANMTELGVANQHLSQLIRRVKRQRGEYPYVAVAERQERGAWHWHLAVCGWQDVGLLRAAWLRVAGDGNIDVKAPRSAGNARLGIVKYLCKYLGKSLGEEMELNARRFRSSRIAVPEARHFIPVRTAEAARDYCQSWLKETAGDVGFFVYCPTTASGFGCSW